MKYNITEEQKQEILKARRANKNKRVEKRLTVLYLRAEGKSISDIVTVTGYSRAHINNLIASYCNEGLSVIVDNHYSGNRRNMSAEDEAALLEQFKVAAEAGHVVDVREIKTAYEEKVGHSIGGSQIYYVLNRQGWRKVMPRSKHPNKASSEVIETSKKLTPGSKN